MCLYSRVLIPYIYFFIVNVPNHAPTSIERKGISTGVVQKFEFENCQDLEVLLELRLRDESDFRKIRPSVIPSTRSHSREPFD